MASRVARAAWRRRRLVLGVFLSITLGAWLVLRLVPNEFESEASLLVLDGDEPGTPRAGSLPRSLEPEVRVLRSRRVIEKVVDELGPRTLGERGEPWLARLGLSEALTDRDRAVLRLERSLGVVGDERSSVITLSVRLRDARAAARALETLIDKYLETPVDVRPNRALVQRLDDRLVVLDASLARIRGATGGFSEERSSAEVDEARGLLLQRLGATQARRDANLVERRRLSRQRAEIAARLDVLPERVRGEEVERRNPVRDTLEQRLAELKLQRQDQLSRFQPGAPPVARVEEVIAGVEALLAGEGATRLDSVSTEAHPLHREFAEEIGALEVRIAGLAAEDAALERQAERIGHEMRRLRQDRAGLAALERADEGAERSYTAVSRRRWAAEVVGELEPGRVAAVALLSPPSVPLAPARPSTLLVLGTVLPLALVLGVGIAFAREAFDARPGREWALVRVEGPGSSGRYVACGRGWPQLASGEPTAGQGGPCEGGRRLLIRGRRREP